MENSNSEFLKFLLNIFEEKASVQDVFRAKIIESREKGVLVKLSGLFGYIGFNYMPWKYNDIKKWGVIDKNDAKNL